MDCRPLNSVASISTLDDHGKNVRCFISKAFQCCETREGESDLTGLKVQALQCICLQKLHANTVRRLACFARNTSGNDTHRWCNMPVLTMAPSSQSSPTGRSTLGCLQVTSCRRVRKLFGSVDLPLRLRNEKEAWQVCSGNRDTSRKDPRPRAMCRFSKFSSQCLYQAWQVCRT